MSLRVCAACERHRRASEVSCPFCGESSMHEPALRQGEAEGALRSRAALVFGGVALAAAAAVSCAPKYGGPPPMEPPAVAPESPTGGEVERPAPSTPDAGPQQPSVVPLYGAPALSH